MRLIEIESLSKYFGRKAALEGVTLHVEGGDLFGLFGPNGAGKTTLLRVLTGQLEPDRGAARVLGINVAEDPLGVKRKIGIVPEVESPPTYLTTYEYLYFVARIRGVQDIDDEIGRWLDFFSLGEVKDVICRDLSKGMRQKLMIASAFIHEPELVFLDEPFINLDPIYQRKLKDFLTGYVENGGTVFMCSHILEISERLCNRIAILSDGRLVAEREMSDLLSSGERLEDIFLRLVSDGG